MAIILKTRLAPGPAHCFIRNPSHHILTSICPRHHTPDHASFARAAFAIFMA
ncbi:MAG: hypothetical protein LBC18_00110 [Opitutaceae bacterium]|nr:hypothetical protein [Opitutaceae bacterium]